MWVMREAAATKDKRAAKITNHVRNERQWDPADAANVGHTPKTTDNKNKR